MEKEIREILLTIKDLEGGQKLISNNLTHLKDQVDVIGKEVSYVSNEMEDKASAKIFAKYIEEQKKILKDKADRSVVEAQERALEDKVSRKEIQNLQKIVYGAVGLVLTSVLVAGLAQIIK